jgi:hypothetical protein
MRSYWPLKDQKEKIEQALSALVKAQLGKWDSVPATNKGGRPTRIFRLLSTSTSTKPYDLRGEPRGCVDVDAPTNQKNAGSSDPDSGEKTEIRRQWEGERFGHLKLVHCEPVIGDEMGVGEL